MLSELTKIIEIEGITSRDGAEARKKALENWISTYVAEISIENSILKKKLTATDHDYIKYHLALQIAEQILEDHAAVISEKSKIKVKLLVLKKDFPKNKE